MTQFMTKKEFGENVEEIVRDKGLSYMEAILHICDREDIEPEDARKFVPPVIKSKLEAEARKLNFLPKHGTLELE
jgi:hypothetical protein